MPYRILSRTSRRPRRQRPQAVQIRPATTPLPKVALLVGIEYTNYANRKIADRLPGCHDDVRSMARRLRSQGYVVRTLLDDGRRENIVPTMGNILASIRWLVTTAITRQVESVVFHYSGHGTQIRDRNGDERDGKDEAIVPADYLTSGVITDDTLNRQLAAKLPPTVKCTCIMDSCHSGTVIDLPYRFDNSTLVKTENSAPIGARVSSLSGCQDTETSISAWNLLRQRKFRGALTVAVELAFDQYGYGVSARDAYSGICKYLKDNGIEQNPLLCFSGQYLDDSFI